jgi:hypothetical protein
MGNGVMGEDVLAIADVPAGVAIHQETEPAEGSSEEQPGEDAEEEEIGEGGQEAGQTRRGGRGPGCVEQGHAVFLSAKNLQVLTAGPAGAIRGCYA